MSPGRVAPPYSRVCVGCGRGNGSGAGNSVVLPSNYVQAAAVKPVHTGHHWLSEHPGFRCVRPTHSKLVRPQRQPVVCPYAGERAECSLCDGERQRHQTTSLRLFINQYQGCGQVPELVLVGKSTILSVLD